MLELQPVRQIRTVELRRPRIRTFDGARGFALLLAIVAHAMTLFPSGLGPYEQDVVAVIVMTTKAAPPLFVFVFGLTMAYVYSEQVMTPEGFAHVRRRLWTRALFAFLSFELIVLVVETANGSTLHVIFERMTYRRPGSWAEVLNYYAVVLLTAPWFLRLWQNAPMSYRILSIPVLYVAGVLLSHVAVPGSLFVLKNIITSYPLSEVSTVRLDSFPVLQFSAFCLVGLLLGGVLYRNSAPARRGRVLWIAGMSSIVCLILSFLSSGDRVRDYIRSMARNYYRYPPQLPYIFFGLGLLVAIMIGCVWVFEIRGFDARAIRMVELLGRHSLLVFNLQYIIYFTGFGLVMGKFARLGLIGSFLVVAFTTGVCLIVAGSWERWSRRHKRGTAYSLT